MFHQFNDIFIPTRGPALHLTRTYNAQSTGDGPFGYGWTHNYQMRLTVTLTKASGSFKLRDRYSAAWDFNSTGRLTRITDRNGNVQTLGYNGNRLTTVTDALGRGLTFTYNGAGKITSIRDFSGRTWSYAYDGKGDLIASTTPSDANTPAYTTHYTYYAEAIWAHNLKTITDPRGETITFTYYADVI
jgi:YD repeat-containing protein